MHPIATTVTLVAAVTNGVALSQSLAGAGDLTLNGSLVSGGVATFDAPRRVGITSAGNDSGITWTITGTSRPEQGSITFSETIAGADAGTAQTTQDFATVTSIAGSGATASTVTAGTTSTGSGPWVPWDQYQTDFQVSCAGFVLSGSPTWTVEYTYDDVFGLWLPSNVPFPRPLPLSTLKNQTVSADAPIDFVVRASRLTLTVVGGVQLVQTQQGM